MARAKRKQRRKVVVARRAEQGTRVDDRGTRLDDRAVHTMLDAVYDDEAGDPIIGIRNGIIAGVALWAFVGAVVLLLSQILPR
jgi:hypothetical protein